jgi:hypothetical protein
MRKVMYLGPYPFFSNKNFTGFAAQTRPFNHKIARRIEGSSAATINDCRDFARKAFIDCNVPHYFAPISAIKSWNKTSLKA